MLWKELTDPFAYKKVIRSSDLKSTSEKKRTKAANGKKTLTRIWSLLTVHRITFYLVLFLVICSTALALVGPVMIGKIIDDFIVARQTDGLASILVFLIIIYTFYALSLWGQNFFMIGIAQKTVQHLRTSLFRHFHKLPISFFDKRQHGELMSRVTNDIENVSSTLNSSVIQIFSSTLTIIGTTSVMFWISPLLTVIILMIIPIMFFGMKWITRRTNVIFKKQQKNLGELNGIIQESISGQSIIKAFSQEQYIKGEFEGKANRLKQTGYWGMFYSGLIPKLMNMLNNTSYAFIVGIGGFFALKGWISIGSIIIFIEFSRQFTRPLNDLANQFNTLLSAIAGAERVFEILDLDEEASKENQKLKLEKVKGNVEFRNVSFSYNQAGSTIKNICFTITAGQTAAFVGPTGAGKTTIINLLSRFYDYDEGQILIDGHDVKNYTRDSVRKQLGFVLQESFLFQGTIRENICYGRIEATDEEMIEAAKQANAHSFIERLPDGYDTILYDSGSSISEGQKQLLAIARAILSNPSILILDEATSSIDTITELHIQQALKRLMEGRTSFVIAHRLNTVREADQIIVLKEGEMIEKGSHHKLVSEKGFYFDLIQAGLQEN